MSDSPASAANLGPAPAGHCLNCGEPFGARRPAFCPRCGQDSVLRPPKLMEFVQQFGGAFFSTEGALWRTLALLLLRPGELTRRYLAGRRKHYVLPLRLYLTVSVVVLLLLRLNAQVAIDGQRDEAEKALAQPAAAAASEAAKGRRGPREAKAQGQPPDLVTIDLGAGRAGMRKGEFFCEGLPQWMCKRIQRRLDVDPKRMAAQGAEIGERLLGNLGTGMFMLLPAFALWLKLAYLNRRLRYTEHLVFALHLHAFWFAMIGLLLIDVGWVQAIAACAIPIHGLLAMRRVYGGRWWPLLLRATAISLMYLVTLTLTVALLGLWALLG